MSVTVMKKGNCELTVDVMWNDKSKEFSPWYTLSLKDVGISRDEKGNMIKDKQRIISIKETQLGDFMQTAIEVHKEVQKDKIFLTNKINDAIAIWKTENTKK